jgi:hypothetical protein
MSKHRLNTQLENLEILKAGEVERSSLTNLIAKNLYFICEDNFLVDVIRNLASSSLKDLNEEFFDTPENKTHYRDLVERLLNNNFPGNIILSILI